MSRPATRGNTRLWQLDGLFRRVKGRLGELGYQFFTDVEKLVHHLETSVGIDMHDDGESDHRRCEVEVGRRKRWRSASWLLGSVGEVPPGGSSPPANRQKVRHGRRGWSTNTPVCFGSPNARSRRWKGGMPPAANWNRSLIVKYRRGQSVLESSNLPSEQQQNRRSCCLLLVPWWCSVSSPSWHCFGGACRSLLRRRAVRKIRRARMVCVVRSAE